MDEKIRKLLDEREIVNLINTLFIATDNRDWDQVKKCFAPAVFFDMTSLAGGVPNTLTPQQIVAGWETGLKDIRAIHHQSGNFRIEIDGDRASVSCYGIAYHYLPNPSNRNTRTFVGSYDFGLLREGSQWLVEKFRYNLKFIDGNMELK